MWEGHTCTVHCNYCRVKYRLRTDLANVRVELCKTVTEFVHILQVKTTNRYIGNRTRHQHIIHHGEQPASPQPPNVVSMTQLLH